MSRKVNITAEAHSANVSSANEYEHRSVLLFEESQENHLQFRLEFLFVRQQDSTLQKYQINIQSLKHNFHIVLINQIPFISYIS